MGKRQFGLDAKLAVGACGIGHAPLTKAKASWMHSTGFAKANVLYCVGCRVGSRVQLQENDGIRRCKQADRLDVVDKNKNSRIICKYYCSDIYCMIERQSYIDDPFDGRFFCATLAARKTLF
jgi:hypothetical protein